jgi:hypothetical protein
LINLSFIGELLASTVKISGKDIEYANQSISLNSYHDFISEKLVHLGILHFNSEGSFKLEFELQLTQFAFADFDGYHGMIYLEPGKSYQLVFPPKRTLNEAQKRNPFAKPDPIWFGIQNFQKDELNVLVQEFDKEFERLESQYFNRIFINQSKAYLDTVINQLDQKFHPNPNEFFETHKTFKKAMLEFALNKGKSENFVRQYFVSTKPSIQSLAYSNLFNQVFGNYFTTLENSNKYPEIKNLVNDARLAELDKYFQEKLKFNSDLSHRIILKSLKDAYYSGFFPKSSIFQMLDQAAKLDWTSFEQKTAQLIRNQLTYLTSGTVAPEIDLKTKDGKLISFSDFKGKYILLHFTDKNNAICQQHLETLKTIGEKYKYQVIVINVIDQLKNFANEKNWVGFFVETEAPIKEIYKVKTYPTTYLIGKDGRLLLSPAPNPIDGLDRQLGQILKSDYIREMQKKNNPAIK